MGIKRLVSMQEIRKLKKKIFFLIFSRKEYTFTQIITQKLQNISQFHSFYRTQLRSGFNLKKNRAQSDIKQGRER